MTEDPILEALFCEAHGRIWERRSTGSRKLPLFYVGALDGYCTSCVNDWFEANIKRLKRVNYTMEVQKPVPEAEWDDYGERKLTGWFVRSEQESREDNSAKFQEETSSN